MISIEFREQVFDGLKFKKANTYSDDYFDCLKNEGSHYSQMKYLDAVNDQLNEQIHIKLSYSLICKSLAIFLIILAFISFKFFWPSIIIASMAIFFQIMFNVYQRRARDLFMGKEMSRDLVELIFSK